MIGLRVILIGLGVALGVALLVHGNVIFGGLILAMAAMRAVMVVRMRSLRGQRLARREEIRQRVRTRGGY